jgi:tetratricopeptide (TPR) repeat protein
VLKHPRDFDRRVELAITYAANGLWFEARQEFLNLERMRPDEPLAGMHAAIALHELGSAPEAVTELRLLTRRFPEFPEGWYHLAEMSLRQGDLPAAALAFGHLEKLAPKEWRAPAGLGETSLREGKSKEAIPFLERAIQIDPSARPPRYLLGQAYRAVGRTNEARLALAAGSGEMRDAMPDLWSLRAASHMRQLPDLTEQANGLADAGYPDRAVRLLSDSLRFHPGNASLLTQLAIACNRAGWPDDGVRYADQALQSDPQSAPARIAKSIAEAQRQHFDQALTEARAVVALAPNLAHARLALANALLGLERDHEALTALDEALRCDPKNAEIHAEIGDVLWHNLKDAAGAMSHFQEARELSPAWPPIYVRVARLSLELGRRDEAREAVAILRKIAPHDPDLAQLETEAGVK